MKPEFPDVWITNSSADNISLEAFANSTHVQNPAGQLFLALLEENTWSKDMTVAVHVSSEPRSVMVSSPHLPTQRNGRCIIVREHDGAIASLHDVAKLVLDKILQRLESIESSVSDLQDLYRTTNNGADAVLVGLGATAMRKKLPHEHLNEKNGMYFRGLVWITDKEKEITYFVKREELLDSSTPPVYKLAGDASNHFRDAIHSYLNRRDSTIELATIVE